MVDIQALASAVDQPLRNAAAALALLCHSGVDANLLLPEICRFCKQAFQLTECSFFWCDQHGLFLDAWSTAPQYLNFRTLMSCARFQASAADSWPTLSETFHSDVTCGALLPYQNARFYESEYYRSTYHSMNVRHLLDLVVRDPQRPYGAFLFKRSQQLGEFSRQERECFAQLVPMLVQACRSRAQECEYAQDSSYHGFALISPKGEARFMDTEAASSVWSLVYDRPSAFANPQAPSLLEQLNRLVQPLWKPVLEGQSAASTVDNRWGRCHFSLERQQRSADVIVHLRKCIPRATLIIGKLYGLALSPLRLLVAWQLLQTAPEADAADESAGPALQQRIADSLGIKPEAVSAHIRALYRSTGTESAAALVASLLAETAGADTPGENQLPPALVYPSLQLR